MPCDSDREVECRLQDLPYGPVKDFAFVGAIVERRGVEQVVYRARPLTLATTRCECAHIWRERVRERVPKGAAVSGYLPLTPPSRTAPLSTAALVGGGAVDGSG